MFRDIKRASIKHKNNKLAYYLAGYIRLCIPSFVFRRKLKKKLLYLNKLDADYVMARVNYYNKLDKNFLLPAEAKTLSELKLKHRKKTYDFDTLPYTRYFDPSLKLLPLFGDITHIPEAPSITKSRPIEGNNENSVLLKLDKIRHFLFVEDKNRFEDKKNMLVGRSKARQAHRIKFLDMYFGHQLCNIGQVNRDQNTHYIAERLTIEEHLKYKFILCLEGNDVASNLKWVMSSNSIAVMPKPKYETWFMEGKLIPNYHYIEIKDDYSDLEERLNYYIENSNEALQIIENAHKYVEQFRNKKQEDLISILVLKKYFELQVVSSK